MSSIYKHGALDHRRICLEKLLYLRLSLTSLNDHMKGKHLKHCGKKGNRGFQLFHLPTMLNAPSEVSITVLVTIFVCIYALNLDTG